MATKKSSSRPVLPITTSAVLKGQEISYTYIDELPLPFSPPLSFELQMLTHGWNDVELERLRQHRADEASSQPQVVVDDDFVF